MGSRTETYWQVIGWQAAAQSAKGSSAMQAVVIGLVASIGLGRKRQLCLFLSASMWRTASDLYTLKGWFEFVAQDSSTLPTVEEPSVMKMFLHVLKDLLIGFADQIFGDLKVKVNDDRAYLTPRSKASAPGSTTPSPPLPYSKRLLTADQKLTKTLHSVGIDADQIAKIKEDLHAKAVVKEQKERERQEKALKKKEKADAAHKARAEEAQRLQELRNVLASQCPDIGEPGGPEAVRLHGDGYDVQAQVPPQAPKKARQGPMTAALKLYVEARKQEGLGYMEAMALWRGSSERAAIVDKMTPAERKKRKYDMVHKPPAEHPPVPPQPPAPAQPAVDPGH